MPWETLAIYLSYTITALMGVVVKTLWDAIKELQKDLSRLREEIGKDYMPRVEIRELFESIVYEIRQVRQDIKAHELKEFKFHEKMSELVHRDPK